MLWFYSLRTVLSKNCFIKKEHVVSVFFDLEKAYDTTWKYGIMSDLHELGLRGRLPTFIENFLSGRSFCVRVATTLSNVFNQEQYVRAIELFLRCDLASCLGLCTHLTIIFFFCWTLFGLMG